MGKAVALVQAYLRVNGYFAVSEYPVIESTRHGYRTATDLDILAFRFPGAGTGRPTPGRGGSGDEDAALGFLSAFVTACAGGRLDVEEIVALTRAMVDVGEHLDWGRSPIIGRRHTSRRGSARTSSGRTSSAPMARVPSGSRPRPTTRARRPSCWRRHDAASAGSLSTSHRPTAS